MAHPGELGAGLRGQHRHVPVFHCLVPGAFGPAPPAGFFTAAANLLTAGATQLLKFLLGRERPPLRLVPVESASYPSGHVSATVAAMVATAIVVGRLWMWISGTVLSAAMMYSRMYLGAHWLSDTIAGALLALGVTLLLWALAHDKCLARYMARRDQTRRTGGQREAPS
ncbi:hypothetical protein B5P43_35075 [Bacillus sp. SRB_336]|nr:hypothetical protein B5P43_35075 [Bacillus sp. SRB_336]